MKHQEPASGRRHIRFCDFLVNSRHVSTKLLSHSIIIVVLLGLLIFPGQQLLKPSTPGNLQDASNNAYAANSDNSSSESNKKGSEKNADGKLQEHKQYSPVTNSSYYQNLTQYSYVLYYGGFDSSVTASILSVKPTLLVTNYYAMDRHTRELFAESNVTVIAYLPIDWTHRDIKSTLEGVRQLLDDGADGIFVDEAVTMSNEWELWYHGQIYKAVKDYGNDKIVVINPGTSSIDERSMLVADIICFEHDWRNFGNVGWALDYPGWRFMGISSNEFQKVMGYDVDSASAKHDLEESRHLNIAYHYSADHYINLPSWLDVYGGIAGSPQPIGDYSRGLDLDSLQHRPEQSNPAVTETRQAGDEHDATVIEELPDKDDITDQEHVNQKDDNEQLLDLGNTANATSTLPEDGISVNNDENNTEVIDENREDAGNISQKDRGDNTANAGSNSTEQDTFMNNTASSNGTGESADSTSDDANTTSNLMIDSEFLASSKASNNATLDKIN